MALLTVLLVFGVLLLALTVAGAVERWRLRRHLPHDLREVRTQGLPSDASIRSGELGRGTASQTFRNLPPFS
jgi:hypothetical protein